MMSYVIDYILAFFFIGFFLWFIQHIGKSFTKERRFSLSAIYGYIIYTGAQAIGGIIIQLLKLDWIYFQSYMTVLIVFYTFYKFKKPNEQVLESLKSHFKQYYLIYLISFVLLVFSLINYEGLWNGNRQDDGWYITQIAQLPYASDIYHISAPTGFSYDPNILRSFNTFEFEAAYFSNVLQIPASIFVKFVLSYLHYFLFTICVCEFSSRLFRNSKYTKLIQYACVGVLFFGISYQILRNNQFLVLTDDWQFNSAMGYGSSVVRTMGIFLLLTPLIERKIFSWKCIAYYILASVALVSKGSQAVPVIYLLTAAMIIYYVLTELKGRKKIIIFSIGVCFLALCPKVGENFDANFNAVYEVFSDNFNHVGIYLLLLYLGYLFCFFKPSWKENREYITLLFMVASLTFGNIIAAISIVFTYMLFDKNEYIKKWNTIMLIVGLLIFLPVFNKMFIDFSIYDFVVKRTITLYITTMVVTNFVSIIYIFTRNNIDYKKIKYSLIMTGVCFCSFYMWNMQKENSIIHSLAVLKNNPELVPESTVNLSKRLEELAISKNETVNVIMPTAITLDGESHYPYVLLRLHAQNVRSISAVARYGQVESENHDAAIRGYSYHEQTIYDKMNLASENVKKLRKDFDKILEEFPLINTFVVSNPTFKEMLIDSYEYVLIDTISILDSEQKYYILFKQ